MNEFVKNFIRCSVVCLLIMAVLAFGAGVLIISFPKAFILIMGYVFGTALIVIGSYLLVSVAVCLISGFSDGRTKRSKCELK